MRAFGLDWWVVLLLGLLLRLLLLLNGCRGRLGGYLGVGRGGAVCGSCACVGCGGGAAWVSGWFRGGLGRFGVEDVVV